MTITLPDQVKCVQREIALRERVYPVWVNRKKMSSDKAAHELQAMQAVLHTLLDLERSGAYRNAPGNGRPL